MMCNRFPLDRRDARAVTVHVTCGFLTQNLALLKDGEGVVQEQTSQELKAIPRAIIAAQQFFSRAALSFSTLVT